MRSGTYGSTGQAQPLQQRDDDGAAAGAIHVVIAEHGHGLPLLHGVGEAVRGRVHVREHRWVRQQGAQRGVEEVGRRVEVDAAHGHQPADDLRQVMPLRDPQADPVLPLPPGPTASREAPLDGQSGCHVLVSKLWCASM